MIELLPSGHSPEKKKEERKRRKKIIHRRNVDGLSQAQNPPDHNLFCSHLNYGDGYSCCPQNRKGQLFAT